jgi:hypothetical protein
MWGNPLARECDLCVTFQIFEAIFSSINEVALQRYPPAFRMNAFSFVNFRPEAGIVVINVNGFARPRGIKFCLCSTPQAHAGQFGYDGLERSAPDFPF